MSMTSVPRICQKYIARVSFAAPSFPSYVSWSGHGRIAWLLPRASPLAPTYAPYHALYAISCHLMFTHTPMVLRQMSQHSQHQSTVRIRVPSGPFGLAEQGLLLLFEHIFLFQIFQAGWERLESTWYSILILVTNQQHFFCWRCHKILLHSHRSNSAE